MRGMLQVRQSNGSKARKLVAITLTVVSRRPLYLVFSVGFTAMSRETGTTGGFYTYITRGLGRPAGVAAASVALLTYKMIQLAVYALFGIFVSGALAGLGIAMPWWLPMGRSRQTARLIGQGAAEAALVALLSLM